MSHPNRSPIVGLAAPGLIWLATTVAHGQAPAAPPGPTPTPAPTFAALLLSNGKVIRGEIVEDTPAGLYRLRQRGGTVPYPKLMVDKAAGSVEELYRFRVDRLPVGDPDERIKLVRWCLTENLPAQAREQLLAVQAMCPGDAEVDRMLANLRANEGRADPDVKQASVEMPRGEAPGSLDPRVFVKVQKRFNGPPVIFDLSPGQAVRRAGQFVDVVQPVLQQSCVKCHNEQYPGQFQLVEIKNRRDLRDPNIARANLDATLRLVNPDDPSRSDLLSAGLVPHGGSKNAIFRGPNDVQYQRIDAWVKSLRPAAQGSRPGADPVSRAGYATPDRPTGDGFAADRGGRAAPAPTLPPLPALPGVDLLSAAQAASPPPSRGTVQTYEESADFSGGLPDSQFQLPYAAGGPAPARPVPPARKPGAAGSPGAAPIVPTTAAPAGPDSVVVRENDDPNKLPGMNQPLYPTSPNADPSKKKAAPRIDNALLEKMMKGRNDKP